MSNKVWEENVRSENKLRFVLNQDWGEVNGGGGEGVDILQYKGAREL